MFYEYSSLLIADYKKYKLHHSTDRVGSREDESSIIPVMNAEL
jgi:hypothetical protein